MRNVENDARRSKPRERRQLPSAMSRAKGKPLELAIGRAGRAYRKDGRAMIVRQTPPITNGPDGMLIYSGSAPIDFIGCKAGGRSLAIEAKSTKQTAWPIALLEEQQRTAMDEFYKMGGEVLLIVAFDELAETYAVPWPTLAPFLLAPWRQSLSPTWCRALGLLVPESDRQDDAKRRCLFLEAAEHIDAVNARIAIAEEQAKELERAPRRRAAVQDELDIPGPPMKPNSYAGLSKDQVKARILAAAEAGLERQLKTPTQRLVWRGGKRR